MTAHRAEIKICPGCGAENRGVLPAGVTGPVQYGNGVKTWAAYFPGEHFVPVERTAQLFEDLLIPPDRSDDPPGGERTVTTAGTGGGSGESAVA